MILKHALVCTQAAPSNPVLHTIPGASHLPCIETKSTELSARGWTAGCGEFQDFEGLVPVSLEGPVLMSVIHSRLDSTRWKAQGHIDPRPESADCKLSFYTTVPPTSKAVLQLAACFHTLMV